ncbi:transposase [aff. Roholtiella sp. LEGE 12411]|uniref:transposase n=1 Tax=aff. Roholtiella sp. LEGE 12411 TaxID=1828822 RepID=UPI0018806911|nr:transposase [aff. Roholtiella sp. LEGE 12411]MBE9033617.1 transposase [aff. Roholtiella sp. LEGE 12411]
MKAYSTDLRQKVMDAHNNKEGSQRQLAKRFSVSLSFVQSLLRRFRFCGTVEAKPHSGGQSAKLNSEQMALIALLVEEDNERSKKAHQYQDRFLKVCCQPMLKNIAFATPGWALIFAKFFRRRRIFSRNCPKLA